MEKEWESMKTNLLSSVAKEGKYVTQIIHFKDGQRKTIHGIISSSIETGKFTKFYCKDGRMIMINMKEITGSGRDSNTRAKFEIVKVQGDTAMTESRGYFVNDAQVSRVGRKAVTRIDQENNGILCNVIPGVLIFKIVVIKLTAPKIDEAPAKCKLKIAKSTEGPECAATLDKGG